MKTGCVTRGMSAFCGDDAEILFQLLLKEPKDRIVSKYFPGRNRLRARVGGCFKNPTKVDVGFTLDPLDGKYRWKLMEISKGRSRARIIPRNDKEKDLIMASLYDQYLQPGTFYFTKVLQVCEKYV